MIHPTVPETNRLKVNEKKLVVDHIRRLKIQDRENYLNRFKLAKFIEDYNSATDKILCLIKYKFHLKDIEKHLGMSVRDLLNSGYLHQLARAGYFRELIDAGFISQLIAGGYVEDLILKGYLQDLITLGYNLNDRNLVAMKLSSLIKTGKIKNIINVGVSIKTLVEAGYVRYLVRAGYNQEILDLGYSQADIDALSRQYRKD
jgi:hypothetical protein